MKHKPTAERFAAALSHGQTSLARAHTGRSSKGERKVGLHDAARLCQAVLAVAHFTEAVGWQLDGIRRNLDSNDLSQEEVEFVHRLREAGITDLRAVFDAVPKTLLVHDHRWVTDTVSNNGHLILETKRCTVCGVHEPVPAAPPAAGAEPPR